MNPSPKGYRVGLAGASSLLGQEILRVLKERGLPVSHRVAFEAEEEEPEKKDDEEEEEKADEGSEDDEEDEEDDEEEEEEKSKEDEDA